jgi:hypothetical protein
MFQPVSPRELEDFFAYVVSILERLNIPYMVVGGFAAITYGEIRFTADVDIPGPPLPAGSALSTTR